MKRLLSFFALFCLGILLTIGCSRTEPNPSSSPATSPVAREAADTLNIYNWSSYIAPEVIGQFEKENKIKINYDTFENNDELYAKIKPGNPGYDVIFPADYMMKIMVADKMLEELNPEKISNLKNIDPVFINPPYDPGNRYSVPYQWGTLGIGYNLKKTGKEIDSWANLIEEQFQNRTAWLDDMRHTLGFVLIYLGYDPNTTNPEEITKAKDFIIEHKDVIAVFAPDTGQVLLDQGQVDLTMEYSGDIFQVMQENPDLRYAIPKEGTVIWTDNMAIPKGAPHRELAEKFINFILEPEVGAAVSNFIHYGSPNKTAKDQGLIQAEDLNNPAIYPPEAVFKKLQYLKDVGEATTLYDEAWTEIKVAVGQ